MPYNEAASSSLAEFVSRNLIVAVLTSNLVIFSYVASRELGRTAEVTASQTAIYLQPHSAGVSSLHAFFNLVSVIDMSVLCLSET